MSDRELLLKRVQLCDFVLFDTALYLDSNPHDQVALRYYGKYQELREQAMKEYTAQFGPLRHGDYDGSDTWKWVEGPWPWQKEA